MDNIDIVFDKKDKKYGGVSSLITGTPGCGKTNGMGRMTIEDYEKKRTVWRGKKTCQWTIFIDGKHPIIFWLPMGVDFKLIDREIGREVKLEEYGIIKYYKDAEELVDGIEKGYINVVYTKNGVSTNDENLKFISEWNDIFEEMTDRTYPDDISIHFGEMKDLAPESKAGFYLAVTEFENKIKEFRKNWIHFNGDCHKETEIFWMVRDKIVYYIKMKGSKRNGNSKLFKSTLSKLKLGEAYIEDDNRFDFIRFTHIGKPRNFVLKIKK